MYIPETNNSPLFAGQENTVDISGLSPGLAAIILFVSLSRLRVRHLSEQGSLAAKAIERIQQRQERFFSFVVLLQSLTVILTSTMGSIIALEAVGGLGGFILGTIVMTLMIALLGEVTPKVLGAHAPERF